MRNGVAVAKQAADKNFHEPMFTPVCEYHYKQHRHATRLLPIVSFAYFLLFIPLMMMPVVGWLVLIAIGNYRDKLLARIIPMLN